MLRRESAADRIGLVGTPSIVLSMLLSKSGGAYDGMVADVWSHMVSTAPLAEVLSLGERADHARRTGISFDFDGIRTFGEFSADQHQCRGILGRHLKAA